jgi:preprotein translocase subunit SecA
MNKQREVIYGERRKVLQGEDMQGNILAMLQNLTNEAVDGAVMGSKFAEEWDFDYLDEALRNICRRYAGLGILEGQRMKLSVGELKDLANEIMLKLYEEKGQEIGVERMRELERMILLMVIDGKWMDHIDAMDQLKTGIGLRSLGQQDPAAAYAQEGFDMFELMEASIQEDAVRYCYSVTLETRSERRASTGAVSEKKTEESGFRPSALERRQGGPDGSGESAGGRGTGNGNMPQATPQAQRESRREPVRRTSAKVGRNDLCPCGSGKKFKNCCGRDE